MNDSDIRTVSEIHVASMKRSFLGKLGPRFLRKLYQYMSEDDCFKCFIAQNNSGISGFISISMDPDNFSRRIYKKHFLNLGVEILLSSLKDPRLLIQALMIFFSKSHDSEQSAELLTIAVNKERRGAGIGKALLEKSLNYLLSNNKRSLFVIVNVEIEANKFYQSLGFAKKETIKLHGDLMNLYELKVLNEHV